MKYRIKRTLDFCYGHRLLDYEGKCSSLHGHNGRAIITLEASQLDRRGMVFDFSELKRVVGNWIDQTLDHRMLLRVDDPAIEPLLHVGEKVFVMSENPTAENIARLIAQHVMRLGFPVAAVTFFETASSSATFALNKAEASSLQGRLVTSLDELAEFKAAIK